MIAYTCINCGASKDFPDTAALKGVTCGCGVKGIVPDVPIKYATVEVEPGRLAKAREYLEKQQHDKQGGLLGDDRGGLRPRTTPGAGKSNAEQDRLQREQEQDDYEHFSRGAPEKVWLINRRVRAIEFAIVVMIICQMCSCYHSMEAAKKLDDIDFRFRAVIRAFSRD